VIHLVNEFIQQSPFDLYGLHLFRLVARARSFTKAAELAGLTQSAITRQIQGLELSLGVNLLERTTRAVEVTEAGAFLYREAAGLLGSAESSFTRLRQEFANARKEIRVGVSRSIGLSYLPGFFHANLRRETGVGYRVAYQASSALLSALEGNELDIGVLCPPKRLPRTLQITHRFADAFILIVPAGAANPVAPPPRSKAARAKWAPQQNWLLLDQSTNTGAQLRHWMARANFKAEPVMQLDSFDLIIQLVALGMGVSLVPIRALALFGQKHHIQRCELPDRFVRELVVVSRRHRQPPAHLQRFISNILF
jgi:DNA-binding transcriptional LysR family regulator